MRIGILALQGAFIEHKHSLDALGVESFEIRQKKDIEKPFDGLIIPGGESTVIGKLLHKLDLYEPIKNMIENDAYCTDVLVQVSAIRSALNSFSKVLLTNHIKTCVVDNLKQGNDEVVDELVATLQKLLK